MAKMLEEYKRHHECGKMVTNHGIRRRNRKTKDETAEAKTGVGCAMRDVSLSNGIKVMKLPKGKL